MTHPFILSIEPINQPVFTDGFHLGTDELAARKIAEGRFHGRNKWGFPTQSVALMRNNQIWDVYDGEWMTEIAWDENEASDF